MLSNRLLRPTLKNIKLPNDGKGFHHLRHRHLLPKLNITDETIVNNNNNKALESVKTRQLHLILKEKKNRNNNKNNNHNKLDEDDQFADDDQNSLLSFPHEIRAVDKRLVGYGLKERNNYSIIFDYLRPNQACLLTTTATTFSRSEKEKGSSSPPSALLLFSQVYWNKRVDDAVLKKRQIHNNKHQQQIQPLQRIINGSSDGIPHIFVDLLYAECNNNNNNNDTINSSLEKVSLWMGCNSDAMIQSGVFTAVYNRLRQIFDCQQPSSPVSSSSFALREVTVSLDAKNCTVAREIVTKMLSEQQEREEIDATTTTTTTHVKPKVNIVTGLVSDFSIGSKMLPNDGHVVIETDDNGGNLNDSSGIIKIDRDPGTPLPFDRRLRNVRQFLQAYTSSMMLSKNSNNKNKNARNSKMILCYDCDPATCQYLMTPFSTMANNSQKNKKSKKKNTTTTRQDSFNYFSSNLDFVAEVSRLAGVVADHDETNNTDNDLFNIQHISNNIDNSSNNKNTNVNKNNFDENSSDLSRYLPPASGVVDKSLIVYQLHIASKRGIQRAVNDLNDIIEKLAANNNDDNIDDKESEDEIAMITLLAPRKIFTWPDEFPTPHETTDEQQDQKKRNSSKAIFSSSRQLFNRILKKLSEKAETTAASSSSSSSSSKVNFDLEIVRSFNSVSNDFPAKIYSKQQDNQSDDEIGDMTAVVISVVRK